jgi:phosphatidylglycerol:prolipoprotein diacylglycerol transferase
VFAQAIAGNGIDFLRIFDGEKGIFGAFIGAGLLSLSFLTWRRLPVLDYVDAAMPALFLGYVMMRILCFMDGHCFGIPTDVPWSVTFVPGTQAFVAQVAAGLIAPDALHTLPVHPTQLYHALLGVAAFVVLLRMKTDVPGRRFAAALILYGAGRFVIEFYRGDAIPVLGPLDVNHIAALVMLMMGITLWRFRIKLVAAPDSGMSA